ncbi:MAG: 50S ribosomal protein L2 [Flavobacteriales bacterium]|jgi:large subunit ribosomal protein L2|nr:50S ribosomal protein L2 [Flavobacteriales bacterium]MDG1933267.1 50S ribosomal protein L2 [Flavobacteriales bacterium]MDG2086581.1 50S ribosomal protein L2 [Flavobacteriales bacterium]|tara:strand:- start:1593 stop:2420 length:828 start_codon:yes stop_codon:yes gene_type:complete
MALKKFRPITPGQRHKVALTFDDITTSKPEKSLLLKKKKSGGRNDTGKMTIENIGGGHKQRYRIIDFKRDKFSIPAKVASIEYDPNRTANIALLHYVDGEKRYMIAPTGLEVGTEVVSDKNAPIKVGNCLPLSSLPLGTVIHNIELKPGQGAILVRSAGSSAQLMAKDGKYAVIKLSSGEIRKILMTCLATIGSVSNHQHQLEVHGKAGRRRWMGRRPNVRATVKNPVDHPMGGGEAKSSGGHPRNKNGVPAKGYKTRDKKKASSMYIIERRKKK